MLYSVTAIKFETGEALLLAPVQYSIQRFVNYYWQNAMVIPLEELHFDVATIRGLIKYINESSDKFRAGRGYLCEVEEDTWVDYRQPYMPHWCDE